MTENYLGYLKYDGEMVSGGYLSARKSAQALAAFDSAIRYFLLKQNPGLAGVEFEIPVRVQKGSWEALIPTDVIDWAIKTGALGVSVYVTTAATQAAKKDFENFGFAELVKKSVVFLQYLIKLGKHLGSLGVKSLGDLKWRNNNTEVGITNSKGEVEYFPAEFLKYYEQCKPEILEGMAELVERERVLKIGVAEAEGTYKEESVTVEEKRFFSAKEELEDELFPQLRHGDMVSLEGRLTRGTQTSNSLGFQYQDHILTCYPESGSIVKFKPALFLKCIVHGEITRADKHGRVGEPRPKIIISSVEPLEKDGSQGDMWD